MRWVGVVFGSTCGRNVVRMRSDHPASLTGHLNAKANQIVRDTTQPDPRIRISTAGRSRPNSRAPKDSDIKLNARPFRGSVFEYSYSTYYTLTVSILLTSRQIQTASISRNRYAPSSPPTHPTPPSFINLRLRESHLLKGHYTVTSPPSPRPYY